MSGEAMTKGGYAELLAVARGDAEAQARRFASFGAYVRGLAQPPASGMEAREGRNAQQSGAEHDSPAR